MAFEGLTEKLSNAFKKLRGKGRLSEADVKESMREIRLALLEADVNYKVVKDFIKKTTERCVGADVLESLTPAQMIVKIVNEELTALMGSENQKIKIASQPPTVVMLVGLQGAGKTTNGAKLAGLFKKQGKRPLLVACDIYRPAAIKQLEVVGGQLGIPVFQMGQENPVKIAKAAIRHAQQHGNDMVFLDTAGRLHVDEALMDELKAVKAAVNPDEILLVVDAMTGQDAVSAAKTFDEYLDITGVMLSKLDGDARGGAALSIKAVTGKPIKFIGTGEKLDQIEPFHPGRMASRILGMGDVLTLIDKVQQNIDEQEAKEMQKKMLSKFFKENQSLLKKQFIETLLINPVTSFSPEQLRQCLSLGLNPDLFYLIGVKCNTTNRMNILQNQEYYISYSLSKKINKDYEGIASCYIGNIVYILMPVTSADPIAEAKSLAHSLVCYTREKLFSSITIGISELGNSIQQFTKLNKQIQYCFSYKASNIVSLDDSILFFAEINDYNSSIIEINEIISNLINAIQTRNLCDALEIGDAFFSLIQNENLLNQQDAIKLVELNLHIQLKNFLDDSKDSNYLTPPITRYCMEQPCSEHSRTVFSNCIKNIIQELSSVTTRNTGIIVNAVIEYIHKNYEKQIGLNDAAEFINRNSSYISRLLKKELSMGFSQLLTERRMEAAKDLLAHTTMKVSDIS